jgi:hypothetical protein
MLIPQLENVLLLQRLLHKEWQNRIEATRKKGMRMNKKAVKKNNNFPTLFREWTSIVAKNPSVYRSSCRQERARSTQSTKIISTRFANFAESARRTCYRSPVLLQCWQVDDEWSGGSERWWRCEIMNENEWKWMKMKSTFASFILRSNQFQ